MTVPVRWKWVGGAVHTLRKTGGMVIDDRVVPALRPMRDDESKVGMIAELPYGGCRYPAPAASVPKGG